MRVLWLCNIMLPMIAEQFHREVNNKEGWLSGLVSVVLERQRQNDITLAVAFPAPADFNADSASGGVRKGEIPAKQGTLLWYCFEENVGKAHIYEKNLEAQMEKIIEDFHPDVIHCFGTEYPHTLAMCRVAPDKGRLLVGIQGLCGPIANAYYANLPEEVIGANTLRDWLKQDSIVQQRDKFALRGEREREAICLAGNVTGRTAWDRHYISEWNPAARYFEMNETLRSNFYEGEWRADLCEPHSVFLSQGDYPLKGLHYMLLALPRIREMYPDVKVYVAGNSIVSYRTLKEKLKIGTYGKYLRKIIRENHLEDCLQFMGKLDAAQMKEQFLKSSLFVCCSAIENSPNSLGEAMLLGMPCVSANVGGISSIFTDGEDGILYETDGKDLTACSENLAAAVLRMWSDSGKQEQYRKNAQAHARRTHAPEANYKRLIEIYTQIAGVSANGGEEIHTPTAEKLANGGQDLSTPIKRMPANGAQDSRAQTTGTSEEIQLVFVSNYINHHQIPFCNAMRERLGDSFVFIQTEPMEEERIRMGWQAETETPYVRYYYREPENCRRLINDCRVLIFGGVDDESYLADRLASGKRILRYSERLYKEGQWKAISPRGLRKKYRDHIRYRKSDIYLLCAGAYVPSDFHLVRAYPNKMLKWGYFPETRHYDVDKLMRSKEPASLLWAARFLDWKHPELALECAKWLKDKGLKFHMNLVGDGEERPLVERLMEEYKLSDCVTLKGYCTPEQVRSLMETTDIYLATSDRKEGWGAVINEAMNSGCAVVAGHRMGAAPYLIRHRENGLIFRDGQKKMLFCQVEELLQDRDFCERLGRRAIETIEGEWNAETAADRLVKFLETREMSETTGPCSPAEVIREREMYSRLMRKTV